MDGGRLAFPANGGLDFGATDGGGHEFGATDASGHYLK